MNGIQDRVGGFFEKNNDLPMYKDKPYSYASSRRQPPVWRRKRYIGVVISLVMIALYMLEPFGKDAATTKKAKETWTWLQRPESISKVDWLERREHVKDAFILSWDAYDRYGWGMFRRIHLEFFHHVSRYLLNQCDRLRRVPSDYEKGATNGAERHGMDHRRCIGHPNIDEFDHSIVPCQAMDVYIFGL